MSGLALIAGSGRLPALLVAAMPAPPEVIASPEGTDPLGLPTPVTRFRVERLVPFLHDLLDSGVERVVFAGAVTRPQLDPALFDPATAQMVPRLLAAMQAGDDATLREVIAIFEEAGLAVTGAAEVAPNLVPDAGVLGRAQPSEADSRDAARAARIVAALGAADVGQGAVVAQGLCLAVEALPGTDAMLAQVAGMGVLRPDPGGARGVLYKAPKPGQDRRIDLPAIGPDTVMRAAEAGLAGVAFEAGGVLLLDRAEAIARADAAGLFLWARPA
jgi:UDP-2,3-diacylglucosamine hydrolase